MRNKDKYIIIPHILIIALCVTIATGIGWLFHSLRVPETNTVIVYLLSIILIARFTKGYVYGIISSIIATCTFNYFFTIPYFTLSVDDPTYIITFVIMTVTSIITSALTSKVKQSAIDSSDKEAETSALYRLTNLLTDASDITTITSIVVKVLSEIMNCRIACLCFDRNGIPQQSYIQQKNENEQIRRDVGDIRSLQLRIENLHTPYDINNEFYDWPIYGRDSILGIIRVPIISAKNMSEPQLRLLRSMIESTSLAMDRLHSVQERIQSIEETTQERYRSNLLRSISHDLRTPLSGIMGTSEMLMDMTDSSDNRYSLAKDIYQDADWLHSLVENILNLTRLQDGRLELNKESEVVEEVISVALMAISKRMPQREITVNIPSDILIVPMDAKLIGQVIVNLLDNAIKHTSLDQDISITVHEDIESHVAIFTIADRGCGIIAQDLSKIFQIFYTTHNQEGDSQRGIGLGLAICESIIKAHGGTITASNRLDGAGAKFTFTLPMEN